MPRNDRVADARARRAMTAGLAAFDHAVVTVGGRMDEAVAVFRRLGFQPTPRGYHTLGSINHLLVFGSTYIELLGVPDANADLRPELRDAPEGLSGLVIRSADADATHAAVVARGAPVQAVQRFGRPVLVDGQARDALFRTVRTEPGSSAAGRVYFCEHLTPELVWHGPWQTHENGAIELVGASIRVNDVERERALWRALLGHEATSEDATSDRGSADDGFEVRTDPVRIDVARSAAAPAMTALRVRVRSLDRVSQVLAANGVDFRKSGDVLRVSARDAFNVEINFVEHACAR